MKLSDAWIHGFRRFGGAAPHRLRLDTKLVCLIGANEVGKSTILAALEIAHTDSAVPPADRSRAEQVPDDREIVRLRYRLDDADRTEISRIPSDADPATVRWFEIIQRANGTSYFKIEPPLRRVRGPRRGCAEALRAVLKTWWPEDSDVEEDSTEDWIPERDSIEAVIEVLESDEGTLPNESLVKVQELSNAIAASDDGLATRLRDLANHEADQHPTDAAMNALWRRCPDFLRFDDETRQLASEYDLTTSAASPGAALRNLAELANLDLVALRNAIQRGETGTVRDLREAANRVLEERFSVWHQHPQVRVSLENDGPILRIHVQSGSGPTMPFHERSDGLREFVALVALTAQQSKPVPPILLIDEIETHLHYDAQVDLIRVLTEQTAAAQVIYTTHSAASLPEDLGLGVRVVEPVGERTASTIRQNFWRDQDPGMGALLMALGAASIAFVPLRPAIIVEGGSDLVLLPTLFREATGSDHVGFAVVPGSSSAPPERLAGLDLQGVRTAWVFDADDGGRSRRGALIEHHIPEDRMLLLADHGDLEIEDLVEPETFCRAVTGYVSDVQSTADSFTVSDLPTEPCRRPDAVRDWCEARSIRPPGKVALANKVIELAGDMPILDRNHAPRLRDLHGRLFDLFAK